MRNKKGFTLIELLLTSGTVAVLFSMFLVSYNEYHEKQEELKTSYEEVFEDIDLEEINIDEILKKMEEVEVE